MEKKNSRRTTVPARRQLVTTRNLRVLSKANMSHASLSDDGKRASMSWATTILSLLSLLAPVAYLVGYYFEEGYLRAYGIGHGMFVFSTQEYIAESFIALGVLLGVLAPNLEYSSYIKWTYICVGIIVYVVVAFFLIKQLETAKDKYPFLNKVARLNGTKTTLSFFFSWLVLLLVPAFLVYSILALLAPAIVADRLGNREGRKEIESFRGCTDALPQSKLSQSEPAKCVYVLEKGKEIAQGILIVATEKYVAVFDGKQSMIISIKPETTITHAILQPK